MESCVYKIQNIVSNKIYIGSTQDFNDRKAIHIYNLRHNIHPNKKLQYSWNKNGENNFQYEILEHCNVTELEEREEFYIHTLKPFYNIRKVCGTNRGLKHSKQTLEKLRKRSEDLWKREEFREKMRTKGFKAILCYDSYGNFVREFESTKEASDELEIFPTNITSVLKKKNVTMKGYHFIYKTSDDFSKIIEIPKRCKIKIKNLKTTK